MKWTVLLLRPDDIAGTFGHDTFCAHVEGATPKEALVAAQTEACKTDDYEELDNYYCLFCIKGHVVNYVDGHGGVV